MRQQNRGGGGWCWRGWQRRRMRRRQSARKPLAPWFDSRSHCLGVCPQPGPQSNPAISPGVITGNRMPQLRALSGRLIGGVFIGDHGGSKPSFCIPQPMAARSEHCRRDGCQVPNTSMGAGLAWG